MDEELTEKEKIEQENFFLKSKIVLQNGHFEQFSELDPEIENQFLKNIFAVENAEQKIVNEVLNINPKEFPPSEKLSEKELKQKLEQFINILEKHGFSYNLCKELPNEIAYDYLTKNFLNSITDVMPEGWVHHIDGCGGDCPSCFQANYCKIKNKNWTPEEFDAEVKRRLEEDLLDE
ncbi:MAG: hypothetical protein A2033_16600 [Bacteroidetes bacterium GWA2_31_9]|nr:MAG: hypothetical protein A2033_16600 [Bacteroidetes bacterium GWA2_31_9]